APQIENRLESTHFENQRAWIDIAAHGHDRAQCIRMFRHFWDQGCRFCLQWFDHLAHDRDARRAHLLAFVTGHTVEDSRERERPGDLGRVISRIKRGLAELHERSRPCKVREIAEAYYRAGRVAAHASNAIERLRRIFHLLMAERLGESAISFGPLEPWLELLDLPFERPAVDSQITDDREVAQRLDRHIRLDRLPTR